MQLELSVLSMPLIPFYVAQCHDILYKVVSHCQQNPQCPILSPLTSIYYWSLTHRHYHYFGWSDSAARHSWHAHVFGPWVVETVSWATYSTVHEWMCFIPLHLWLVEHSQAPSMLAPDIPAVIALPERWCNACLMLSLHTYYASMLSIRLCAFMSVIPLFKYP